MEINEKSFQSSSKLRRNTLLRLLGLLFFISSQSLCAQDTIENWADYFQDHYGVVILTDSIDMAQLHLDRKTTITGSDGINYLTYAFEISYQNDHDLIEEHLSLLAREFLLYPEGFFRSMDLKFLCLVQTATFAGQIRAAIPDPLRKTLILETSQRLRTDTTYQKHVFHHDLFHYVESKTRQQIWAFRKWNKLNAKTFHYRGSGAMQFNPKYAHVNWSHVHPQEGFITNYAMTAEEEDRAEITAFLLIPEKRNVLMTLLQGDKILRKKVVKIQRFLEAFGVRVTGQLPR